MYADASLVVFNVDGHILYLVDYVDDIITTGNDAAVIDRFVTDLAHLFSIKDLGLLTYFFSVEVVHNKNGLLLSQKRYIQYLLTQVQMHEAKHVLTPMPTSHSLTLQLCSSLSDPSQYKIVIGGLQYLLITRLDIAFTVNKFLNTCISQALSIGFMLNAFSVIWLAP